jgi:fructan beta-fructosidase
MKPGLFTLVFTLVLHASGARGEDILIADFEGKDYGAWKTTGKAFGSGPARGTLPGQMAVSGFLGKGLVNSFFEGDKTTGTLTSPPVTVQRPYINFLLGGGHHPGKTCVNLLLDGKVVRTATGPNINDGGSEKLDWHTWDVKDLDGKQVVIQIVDQHTGGWGHINVDQIVQGDRRLQAEPAHRELIVTGRYLNLPVKTGGTKRQVKLMVGDKTVREFEIELADGEPSFWAFADLTPFKGKTLRIETSALPKGSKAMASITQGDSIKGADKLYKELNRPQFHFTSRRGWLNDPNGLVYYQGEYHLFYQHNPYGWAWGNMHWGHAVSKDLLHWQEEPIALYPRKYGDWAFSGSAVVDNGNTSGFGKDGDPLVLAYTSTGRGECIAYSNDRGRHWTEYEGNPVVKHQGRDPKLVWYSPGKRWVMAVYDETGGKRWISFYSSPDLKQWTFQSRIEGFFECPDLFELPVQGGEKKSQWVLYAADGKYVLGDFDGKKFTPETEKLQVWHGNFYAAQTFSDTPDGRRIQIGWGNGIAFPGMPFNQQMTIPCRLTLRKTADGVRMFAYPVKEVESLRGKPFSVKAGKVRPAENPMAAVLGELFDVSAEVEPGDAAAFGFNLRGVSVVYDVKKQELQCGKVKVPLKPVGGKVRLRLLLDRGSLEVFGNDGRAAVSLGFIPRRGDRAVAFFSRGGSVQVNSLVVSPVKSVWKKP